jgi:hypothetical protein
MTGSGTFKAPLPSASNEDGSLKKIKFKLIATLSACNAQGVTGGKLPITGGKVQVEATLDPGSSCSGIVDFGPDLTTNVAKVTANLTGTSASGGHARVASLHVKSDSFFNDVIPKGWTIETDSFRDVSARDPFPGQSAVPSLVFDQANLGSIGACALGGDDLATVNFGPAAGSKIEIS